ETHAPSSPVGTPLEHIAAGAWSSTEFRRARTRSQQRSTPQTDESEKAGASTRNESDEEGPPARRRDSGASSTREAAVLYVGLDLSRKPSDWHALAADGRRVGEGAWPPDLDGLAHLVPEVEREQGGSVVAAIESMTGARLVHDQLELAGWDVRIAGAQRAKGI